MRYSLKAARKSLKRKLKWLTLIALALILLAATSLRIFYQANLKPVSNNQKTLIVTIQKGSSLEEIAILLHSKNLIRNIWVFEYYVHNKSLSTKLQHGTYALSPSQDVPTVVQKLTKGRVQTKLTTILPGRRLDQVRADLINDGFAVAAVDNALKPENYSDLPVLGFKPANVSTLEGLLYPDSFQKTAETDPAVIISQSLREMDQKFTPDLRSAMANLGLSPYQGLILASIVEQEVSKPADRAQAAQVFLTRLQRGMMLGSDSTARYGAILAGKAPSVAYDSAYNTLKYFGLPPTPIGSISAASLQAVAHPAATDWLYFVSGDDGTTHFSKTLQEHQALTAQYCHKLCN
ncbi:MAG TPA: endolytic transglycosylase MltG [Candidatus Saccharimonadales bacterium]|nr:endolytic transglycosylase MltG [Candidatus Saccharimonadales bacterium]